MRGIKDEGFWQVLDSLLASSTLVVDRPKGSAHPRYPEFRYPLDYGYLENTSSMDGDGIDVWIGSKEDATITAVLCTVDLEKRDSEIKILLGCTKEEIQVVYDWHNGSEFQKGLLIRRPDLV